jgi:ComF family protein
MLPFSSPNNLQPEAQHTPGLLLSNGLLRRGLEQALDLLFPPRCAGCEKVDTHWCAACQSELDSLPFPPLRPMEPDSLLRAVAATGYHDGKLQKVIWTLKFENGRTLAAPLGQRLGKRLQSLEWTIDMIVPVPLNKKRLRQRGYNQSELMAQHIAALHSVLLMPQAIDRTIDTRSQVGLNMQERKENMKGVFRADPQAVADKTILLIDDVCTTGSTLEACAQAALEAGAAAVYALTVSMA